VEAKGATFLKVRLRHLQDVKAWCLVRNFLELLMQWAMLWVLLDRAYLVQLAYHLLVLHQFKDPLSREPMGSMHKGPPVLGAGRLLGQIVRSDLPWTLDFQLHWIEKICHLQIAVVLLP
jgi:hypothetical protein